MEHAAGIYSASAAPSTRTVDQASRDGQVNRASGTNDQVSQMISIASSKELPRGDENQLQAPRLKQESKALPSTSRQAIIWNHVLHQSSQNDRKYVDNQ